MNPLLPPGMTSVHSFLKDAHGEGGCAIHRISQLLYYILCGTVLVSVKFRPHLIYCYFAYISPKIGRNWSGPTGQTAETFTLPLDRGFLPISYERYLYPPPTWWRRVDFRGGNLDHLPEIHRIWRTRYTIRHCPVQGGSFSKFPPRSRASQSISSRTNYMFPPHSDKKPKCKTLACMAADVPPSVPYCLYCW